MLSILQPVCQKGGLMDSYDVADSYGPPKLWPQAQSVVDSVPDIVNGSGKTVLYVGVNIYRDHLVDELKGWGYTIDVLEIWPPNIDHCRASGKFRNVFQADVLQSKYVLNELRQKCILKDMYDVAVWWHGPEHVAKDAIKIALDGLEEHAKLVILGCPLGSSVQGIEYGNPYEIHLATLEVQDIKNLGYNTKALFVEPDIFHLTAWKDTTVQHVGGDI